MANAQNAMNNAANNLNDKKNDWASAGKSVVDRAVSEVKSLNPEDIKRTATELTSKVRDVSGEYYDDAVGYIRRNPVSAGLGLAAVGFLAGSLFSWMRKSA